MGSNRATFLDLVKLQNPDGTLAKVAEVLQQMNPALQDGPMIAANSTVGNRVTIRKSLPTIQPAMINKGTPRSKGSVRQDVDTIMLIDGLSEADKRLIKVEGQAAVDNWRRSEDKGFEEAMSQYVAATLFYGSESTAPGTFTGLAPRLNTAAAAITGSTVASMGTVTGGDGTSVYICDWSPDWVSWTHPLHSDGGGLEVENKGEERVLDAAGNAFYALVTAYNWFIGLTVKDPRHIGRLANIDVSDANLATPTQGQLLEALIDVESTMPDPSGGQRVLYCSRRLYAAFHKQAINRFNAALSIQDYLGKLVPHFHGYPIRRVDQISEAESTVS